MHDNRGPARRACGSRRLQRMPGSMKARYFCENCGAEVRPGASSCPSCGRVFTAVRCPECGFEGRASEFARGCPSCGFMEHKKIEPPAVRRRDRRRSGPGGRFPRGSTGWPCSCCWHSSSPWWPSCSSGPEPSRLGSVQESQPRSAHEVVVAVVLVLARE